MIQRIQRRGMSTGQLTLVGMLGAISAVLGFTPIGFITVGAISVTTMHIPVIIGAVLEGPMIGMMTGLLFGIISMIRAFMMPLPTSFIFWNPIIAIVPRVLLGYISYQVYYLVSTKFKKENVAVVLAAFIATLAHTVMVLGSAYLIYHDKLAEKLTLSVQGVRVLFTGIAIQNGIPEAILSVLVTVAVYKAAKKVRRAR
ncbi:MAG: ECF transporter S component [Filifactor alocis]|nr:ECF transporter S component [Filifactor alocis]